MFHLQDLEQIIAKPWANLLSKTEDCFAIDGKATPGWHRGSVFLECAYIVADFINKVMATTPLGTESL